MKSKAHRPKADNPKRDSPKVNGPKVGRPVRGSRTGRPIMVVLDLLGRRSALRLLWELREGNPMTFRALQEAADTNPSLLNTRLRELREAGIILHDGDGYVLTESGKALLLALGPLTEWAAEWAAEWGNDV